MTKAGKLVGLILSVIGIGAFMTGCSSTGGNKRVVIASKVFTENILLGEIYAQLIENQTGIKVEHKQALGDTFDCYEAMEKGEIDMYVEYTGTLFGEVLEKEIENGITSEQIYYTVKQEMNDDRQITVFQPVGLNNTYALGMKKETAETLGVKTMSELSAYAPDLTFAANEEYYTRQHDGYEAMAGKYGMQFKSLLKIDAGSIYDSIMRDEADVILVYATDAHLIQNKMIVLADDLCIFPVYHALPMVRNETLKKFPELNSVLNMLADRISDARMQDLNYQVDVEQKSYEEVAKTFLSEEGLLK